MTAESRDRVLRLGIATAYALIVVWLGAASLGLPKLSGASSDLTLDWLVVRAVVNGQSPYQPIEDLAEQYEIVLGDIGVPELGNAVRVHPRTPGALLLLLPLLLVSPNTLHMLSLILNTAAAVAFLLSIAAATSIRADWLLLAAPLLILSHPAISAFEFGSQSFVVAALVTIAVGLMRRTDSIPGGVSLGLAITLKLWPALLVVLLLGRGHRRSAAAAVATSGALAALASVVFRLSPRQVWDGMTTASSTWIGFSGNGSLAGRFVLMGMPVRVATALSVLLLVAILPWIWDRRVNLDVALWGTIAVAVLASPLSWDHYDVVLIPIAIVLARHSSRWSDPTRWVLLAWAALTLGGRFVLLVIDQQSAISGALAFSERAMILVALLGVVRRLVREAEAVQPPPLSVPNEEKLTA